MTALSRIAGISALAFATTLTIPADASAETLGAGVVNDIARYVRPANIAATAPEMVYLPDGLTYAAVSPNATTIDVYDIKTGKKTSTLFDIANTREARIDRIDGFVISPNGGQILVWDASEPIYRRSSKCHCFVYEVRSRLLKPLSTDFKMVESPTFSPDSRMVAFVAENNVYIKKLDYNTQVPVTTDGEKDKVINGATDWTYEEEFSLTSSLAWAPDNLTLCYLKFNESEVPSYDLALYQGACDPKRAYSLYPGTFTYKYPVAGKPNSVVSLHSYDVETRKTKDLPLPDKKIEYIPRIMYGNDAECLLVATLNRDQNHYEIYRVNPRSAVAKSLYVENAKAWIDPMAYEGLKVVKDGFVVASNKTGWRQLYKYSFFGALTSTISPANCDATEYYGCDTEGNEYYQVAYPTSLDRTVQRLDKKGKVTSLTTEGGTGAAVFSPDMKYATMSFSDINTPPVYNLTTADGRKVRVLEDNAAYASTFKPMNANKEFVKVSSDGYELNAYIIKPANFDASRKYPVVMYQYSGPGSQSVLNKWEMDWQNYFAAKGFVVFCVDGRGTGQRGYDFMTKVYRNLGYYETIDQIAGARYLASQPWVDAKRIGIFGWSYGGYEALMCASAKDNPFAATVAVAAVTDWRLYDTVYTERYMSTPQQNDEGYNTSSALKRANNMTSKLLIMYGTLDDNVHPANSLEYVSALQCNSILCDMLVFPNMNHSIYGCNARAVVYGNMFNFFKSNL